MIILQCENFIIKTREEHQKVCICNLVVELNGKRITVWYKFYSIVYLFLKYSIAKSSWVSLSLK